MSAAAPYGRNGSLPNSSLYSRTTKQSAGSLQQQEQWQPTPSSASRQQHREATPTLSTARAEYESPYANTESTNRSNRSASRPQNMNPELCKCAIKCDECGHELQLPTGCCLTADGFQCQERPTYRLHVPSEDGAGADERRLSSLSQEEAEILAELNRNKYVAGHVQSTRRFVMILAAVHWGFLTYLFSRCKNTGSCDDLIHTIQFYHALPSIISTVFFGAILFGTAIWLTTLLDVSVHVTVGLVKFFRWLSGREEEEAENTTELNSFITTELRDQPTESPATRSTTSHRSVREAPDDRSTETGHTPPVAGEVYDEDPTQPEETAIENPVPTEDSNEQVDNIQEATNRESSSWPGVPWFLTGLVAAGSGLGTRESGSQSAGSRSSQIQQQDGSRPISRVSTGATSRSSTLHQGGQGSRTPGSTTYSPGANTDTRIMTTSHSSTPAREVVVTPYSTEALAAETAARAGLINARETEDHQSRSSIEMVAELSNTFISTVRRSAEALHHALFWGSGGTGDDEEEEERGTTVYTTDEADVDRDRYYDEQLNEEQLVEADRSGTKHSEANQLERQLSSATAHTPRHSPTESFTRTPTPTPTGDLTSSMNSHRGRDPAVVADGDISSGRIGGPPSRPRSIRTTSSLRLARDLSQKLPSSHSSMARSATREVQTSDTLMMAPAPGKLRDPSETAHHILSSAGLSSYSSANPVFTRMEDQIKPTCLKNCAQGAAAPERSADFALMASTQQQQQNAASENSNRNTSALSHAGISPCNCDSAHEDRTPMRSTHQTSAAANSQKSNLIHNQQRKQPSAQTSSNMQQQQLRYYDARRNEGDQVVDNGDISSGMVANPTNPSRRFQDAPDVISEQKQHRSQQRTPSNAQQQQMRYYSQKREGEQVVDEGDVSSGMVANPTNPSRRFTDAPDVISAQKEAVLSELTSHHKRRSKSYGGEALRSQNPTSSSLKGGVKQPTAVSKPRRRRRLERPQDPCSGGGGSRCCNNQEDMFFPQRNSSGGCTNVLEEMSAIAHGKYYYRTSSSDEVTFQCRSDPVNAPTAAAAVLKSKFIRKLERPNPAPIHMIIESYTPSVRLSARDYNADVDTGTSRHTSGVDVDIVGDTGGVLMSSKHSSYRTSPGANLCNSSGAPSTAVVLNQRYAIGGFTSGESRSRLSTPNSGGQPYSRCFSD